MMDVMFVAQFTHYALWGRTQKVFAITGLFFGLRGLVQEIQIIEYPQGYNWDYPGLFAFTVGYGRTSDFWYSGHCGVCLVHSLEFMCNGLGKWAAFSMCTLFM